MEQDEFGFERDTREGSLAGSPIFIQEDRQSHIQKKMESIMLTLVKDISTFRAPYMEMRNEVTRNLLKIEFHSSNGRQNFIRLLTLLKRSYELVTSNQRQNKRDIYYENMHLFRQQSELDSTSSMLCCMLKVPRWDLNIDASAKGLIAGNLQWKDDENNTVYVKASNPSLIPSNQTGFHNFESDAKFVLVVEKDAVFKKIMEEDCFSTLGPFLLATGKGFPDYGTRRLLRKIIDALEIPIFLLVDADPHGFSIAVTYRWGAKDSNDPELCVPTIQLIGIMPSELSFVASNLETIQMEDSEVNRLDALEKRITDQTWLNEIEVMRGRKRKAEIEHLSADSPGYLTGVYLQSKISRLMTPQF